MAHPLIETGIDFTKSDETAKIQEENQNRQDIQKWHHAIKEICNLLSCSSDRFDAENAFSQVETYIENYSHWLYSDISGYLFSCDEQTVGTFLTNLDTLQDLAHSSTTLSENTKVVIAIDKLWDHSNLAQKQNTNLHDNDDAFKARFDKNLIPFESKFTHEMNMQFISLIAIFTALSFIVFGGISSLDNIFSGVKNIPIVELMIIGCIWSLCISNLVFVFMFFVSKLTKISIRSSTKENARLSDKYPFIIWCNYFLLMILSVRCWIYFISYAEIDGWLISLCQRYADIALLIGTAAIVIFFAVVAIWIIKPWKHKKSITDIHNSCSVESKNMTDSK